VPGCGQEGLSTTPGWRDEVLTSVEAIATMAPAPEALCNTPAFIAASHAHLGQLEACAGHRETVYRHHRRQLARGTFPADTSCIDWLLAMDPFRRPADVEHYREGLRKAGFE
jgi:hypothetical protein